MSKLARIIGPTAQQFERLDIRVMETPAVGITGHQNARECLLDALLAQGELGPDAEAAQRRYQAGIWLRSLHQKIGTRDSQTGSYAPAIDTGAGDLSDEQCAAWQTFNSYTRKLPGPTAKLVISVCCWDELPRTDAMMAFLRFGLDRLAKWRGL